MVKRTCPDCGATYYYSLNDKGEWECKCGRVLGENLDEVP